MTIEIRDNKNKIISSKEIPADENVHMVRGLLDQAGHIGRGAGQECIGYAVVFYYRGKFGTGGELRCHSETKMLSEGSANDGWKALGAHVKSKFQPKKGL